MQKDNEEKDDRWLKPNETEIRGTAFSDHKPLIGKEGKTVTNLHPTGEVRVEGKSFDAVAEGTFIEPGEKIRVTGTRDFRLVVERCA